MKEPFYNNEASTDLECAILSMTATKEHLLVSRYCQSSWNERHTISLLDFDLNFVLSKDLTRPKAHNLAKLTYMPKLNYVFGFSERWNTLLSFDAWGNLRKTRGFQETIHTIAVYNAEVYVSTDERALFVFDHNLEENGFGKGRPVAKSDVFNMAFNFQGDMIYASRAGGLYLITDFLKRTLVYPTPGDITKMRVTADDKMVVSYRNATHSLIHVYC